jgi:hypothetical protein
MKTIRPKSGRSNTIILLKLSNNMVISMKNTAFLTLENIQRIVTSILQQYDVDYCYLFGSYARSEAREDSDVDLLVSNFSNRPRLFWLD